MRQVPAVLAALTRVQLTQGALTHNALRRAVGTLGTAYEQLRGGVPAAPVVHPDDTGWRALRCQRLTILHTMPGCPGTPPQQCLAHILRSIDAVLVTKKDRARDFGERLKALL